MNVVEILIPGLPGPQGSSILNGTTPPSPVSGNAGDFYIDTTAARLYGPKTDAGWGAGVDLKGPPGPGGGDDGQVRDGIVLEQGGILLTEDGDFLTLE